MRYIGKLGRLLSQTIFSSKCPCCKQEVCLSDTVCYDCWHNITFVTSKVCASCGKPLYSSSLDVGVFCDNQCCLKSSKLKEVRAATIYDDKIASIIHRFKYQDMTSYGQILSKFLWQAFEHLEHEVDLIVPVPLHKKKLRQRGYNQAAILAKNLAQKAGKAYSAKVLERSRDTASQMALPEIKRQNNVKNAFSLSRSGQQLVQGRKILLVDDVITTGSTVQECAQVLLNAQAEFVSAISIART